MSVDEIDTDQFLRLVRKAHCRSHITLHWESSRIERLLAKANSETIATFERDCARGQLAAYDGDVDMAERVLLSTLRQFRHLYPANGHFFTHVFELALAIKALDLVSLFLNDRYKTPELFYVEFNGATNDPAINQVTIDESRRCHFSIDPRIPGMNHADYVVGHMLSTANLWASYCRSPGCEPGRILVNLHDAGHAPGLAFSGNKPEHILIPDPEFLSSQGYKDLRARYDAARPSWDLREPRALWRGATTGIRTDSKDWGSLPRIRLSQLALGHPQVLDASISTVVQTQAENEKQQIEAAGLVRGRVPEEEFLKFKYQIDIDGNSNAWKGLYQKLLTGSPVLKIASSHGFRQWYYDRLNPWVNYVPVETDMSDLVEKINWLRAHDADALSIGQAGLALAKSLEYEKELESAHQRIREEFRRTR